MCHHWLKLCIQNHPTTLSLLNVYTQSQLPSRLLIPVSQPLTPLQEERKDPSVTPSLLVVSAGEHVARQLCRDAILPMPVICEVPCPKDCALSPWTPWSQCSHTCSGKSTEGKQTRARSILAYNAGEGRRSSHRKKQTAAGRLHFQAEKSSL